MLFPACAKNPFSTRGTEPPVGATGTWETPQSPEIVIQNLLFAYNQMNIGNYQLCLSMDFIFSSPEDSIDAANSGRPDLFANWDKQAEVATATNIFASFSGADSLDLYLSLTRSLPDLIEDSTAIIYREYVLRIIYSHSGGLADTLIAQGKARFHLTQEQLYWWTIRWWEDEPELAGSYDWGDFKAEYR
jgi:hypothetical protein